MVDTLAVTEDDDRLRWHRSAQFRNTKVSRVKSNKSVAEYFRRSAIFHTRSHENRSTNALASARTSTWEPVDDVVVAGTHVSLFLLLRLYYFYCLAGRWHVVRLSLNPDRRVIPRKNSTIPTAHIPLPNQAAPLPCDDAPALRANSTMALLRPSSVVTESRYAANSARSSCSLGCSRRFSHHVL